MVHLSPESFIRYDLDLPGKTEQFWDDLYAYAYRVGAALFPSGVRKQDVSICLLPCTARTGPIHPTATTVRIAIRYKGPGSQAVYDTETIGQWPFILYPAHAQVLVAATLGGERIRKTPGCTVLYHLDISTSIGDGAVPVAIRTKPSDSEPYVSLYSLPEMPQMDLEGSYGDMRGVFLGQLRTDVAEAWPIIDMEEMDVYKLLCLKELTGAGLIGHATECYRAYHFQRDGDLYQNPSGALNSLLEDSAGYFGRLYSHPRGGG